uniref:Uncharacterized protein n=1 Tax=Timema poppense TaxID=170557 RepID=A0A7R9DKW3_TIMPO|nr:unnamed protein product [Timema poppensis]
MDPDRPVMVPGDKEMARSKKVAKDGGIIYDVVQIRAMGKCSSEAAITHTGVPVALISEKQLINGCWTIAAGQITRIGVDR